MSLVYTGEPLCGELVLKGRPRVVLHVSSSARSAVVAAKLCDVAPDGTSALIARGYLNLACRIEGAPPQPIELGRVYEAVVDLLACAYRCEAGHRLRLDLAWADYLNVWPTPEAAVNTVHRGAGCPSRVILPVVPAGAGGPEPHTLTLADPPPAREALAAPHFETKRDPIRETASFAYRVDYVAGWFNTAEVTVSAADPATTVVRSEAQRTVQSPGRAVVVDAQAVTSSDAHAFHHTVDVHITMNGRPFWTKTWTASVPRRWM
jgi:hypothetical protein